MKRRYLEARYDVTGLSEAEADVLAGEVTAMAEASDRGHDAVDHPDVPVELDYTTIEVCRDCGKEIPEGDDLCDSCAASAKGFTATATAFYRGVTATVEIDDDDEVSPSHLVRVRLFVDPPSRGIDRERYSGPAPAAEEPKRNLVGNVVFDDEGLRSFLPEHAGKGVVRDGKIWFDPPFVRLDDPDDPDDEGPLFLTRATEDGSEAMVYAPNCPDANELERRIVVAFGDSGWTLEDYDEAKDPSWPRW